MLRSALLLLALVLAPAAVAQGALDDAIADLVAASGAVDGDVVLIDVSSETPAVLAVVPRQPMGYALPVSVAGQAKSAGIATILSVVIPGAGQMYAGEINRGLTILAVAVGGGVLAGVGGGALTYVGVGVSVAAWIYGIVDAAPAVRRSGGGYALAPAVLSGPTGSAAGLSARLSF